jgi:hypothetical protein
MTGAAAVQRNEGMTTEIDFRSILSRHAASFRGASVVQLRPMARHCIWRMAVSTVSAVVLEQRRFG